MRRGGLSWLLIVVVVLSLQGAWGEETPSAEGVKLFEEKIRPVLVERCYKCHGAEGANRKANLRLDSREALRKGGDNGSPLDREKPGESLLLQALRHEGPEMPPDGKLPAEVIAGFEQWVRLGAPDPRDAPPQASAAAHFQPEHYRQHWALQPVRRPALPPVKQADWVQSPIDAFILAALEAKGLTPSRPADKAVLLRRVMYDLIGLLPTADEVAAFEADDSPGAFARVVDRLLASPQYGERWGRHWLDVARYADTKDGVLMFGDDRVRPYAYTYRDYVIRAFNDDTPIDRFIHEQLAADQVEPPVEPWRLGAMGFLTLGRMFDNNVHDIIDDQIDTVSRGMLGLTVTCARCHDHKYDPIPQADYYSQYGVFAASEAPLELPVLESGSNSPESTEFEQKYAAKSQEVLKFRDEQYAFLQDTARQRTADYLVRVVTTKPDISETAVYFLSLQANDLRPQIVGNWRKYLERVARPDDPLWGLWHEIMALEVDNFADNCARSIAEWNKRKLGRSQGLVHPLVQRHVLNQSFKSPSEVAQAYGEMFKAAYEESKRQPAQGGVSAGVTAEALAEQEARQDLVSILTSPQGPVYFPRSRTRDFMSRGEKDSFGGKLVELDRMAVQSAHAPPRAMVLTDSEQITDPRIFVRGSAASPGEQVSRQFLMLIEGDERPRFTRGSGRLELAQAITSPSNPLTPRVFANRVWMHHFGEPLVASPSDFGLRTSPPTHPELLDYLATALVDSGWSLKKLHRLIVLSSTYQQSSADRPEYRQADPDNRLLWRMNRRRLDLESMRDTLLSRSGRLESTMYGRPVNMAGDAGNRRRTVYGLVDRQSLPGIFRTFDFASPDQSTERRPFTTVPQQALFGMNSAFVVQQARDLLSVPEIAQLAEPNQKIMELYRRILARPPDDSELAASREFVSQPPSGSQLSGWEQLAQVLLLTNEMMFVD